FFPRLTVLTQVGQVAVQGWDPKTKAEIIGQARTGDETAMMGGTTIGPAAAEQAFGQARTARVNRPGFSRAEADHMALGQFKEMALGYITGEGMCIGRTDLRAGTVVQIDGLGQRFSGLYYVTATTHTYLPNHGYRTAFTVRRNAT